MKVQRFVIYRAIGNQPVYFHESHEWVRRFEDATQFATREDVRAALIVLTAYDCFFVPGFLDPLHIASRIVTEPQPAFQF